MKLKKGDTVIVMTGKDKGKTGKIDRVFGAVGKVRIPGINIVKRHTKRRDEQTPGGIIEVVKPIDASKVALVDPKTQKPTRIGYDIKKGEKVRIAKRSGNVL